MDQTQPKHLSPWIAWSLVVLAFGLALFCVWYYYFQVGVAYDNSVTHFIGIKTKTPATIKTATSATTDWKTYTNSTYGFSFKYPKDWTLTEVNQKQDSVNIATLTSPETAKVNNFDKDITISYASPTTTSITNGSGTIGLWLKNKFADITNIKNVTKETINGIIFNEGQIQADPSYFAMLTVASNGAVYAIDFPNIQNKADLTTTENQILSTFQFTK